MARNICVNCERPLAGCICQFVTRINNDIKVVALQHPKEVNHSKGSLPLLERSLLTCHTLIGENFDHNEEFQALIAEYPETTYVLYPSEQSIEISAEVANERVIDCLILIDATWKKAYKMYQLSSSLQSLPHIKLPQGLPSLYEIRKTQKSNALSTLEACCHALALLERSTDKYQPLLNNFVQFNQFQLSFRPSGRVDSSS